MGKIQQQIEIKLSKEVESAMRNIATPELMKKLSEKLIAIMIRRTQDGYDNRGRRFGNYNKSYDKSKAYARAKNKGRFSSSSTSNKLQLSGELFRSLTYKGAKITNSKTSINLKTTLTIDGIDNQLKAEGLQSTTGYSRKGTYSKKSWEFFGLSVSGDRVNQEKAEIMLFLIKELKTSGFKINIIKK